MKILKKLASFLLVAIIGFGCINGTKEEVYHWDNGRKAISFSLSYGKLHGRITSWDFNGNIIADGVCDNGAYFNGTFIMRSAKCPHKIIIAAYSDGNLLEEEPFPENINNALFVGDTCTRKNSVIEIRPLADIPDPPDPPEE